MACWRQLLAEKQTALNLRVRAITPFRNKPEGLSAQGHKGFLGHGAIQPRTLTQATAAITTLMTHKMARTGLLVSNFAPRAYLNPLGETFVCLLLGHLQLLTFLCFAFRTHYHSHSTALAAGMRFNLTDILKRSRHFLH